MKEYEGRCLTVKDWFGQKKANELGRDIHHFRLWGIIKETEKAIYAVVDLGYQEYKGRVCPFYRTMWIPKSVLVDDDDCGAYEVEINTYESEDEAYNTFVRDLKDYMYRFI